MAQAKLPDGSILEVADGATVADLATQIGPGLARVAIAAKINDQLCDLSIPITGEVDVEWNDDISPNPQPKPRSP